MVDKQPSGHAKGEVIYDKHGALLPFRAPRRKTSGELTPFFCALEIYEI